MPTVVENWQCSYNLQVTQGKSNNNKNVAVTPSTLPSVYLLLTISFIPQEVFKFPRPQPENAKKFGR